MTQEQKDLLLKDLCGRLPYHVKVKVWLEDGTTEEGALDLEHNYADVLLDAFYYNKIKDIKPYLFPLSNMTEEHIFEINNILGKDFEIDKYGITDLIRNRRTCLSYLELDALFEYFNKYHFDYRGLIPMGLAIDCTNLNIYE